MTELDGEHRPSGAFHTRIEWIDTDASGIYHNSTVTRLVEAAEATLMRECGLGAYFASAPRVRYEADFLAPLRFGQEVVATVWLAVIGTSSMAWEFEVRGASFEGRPPVLAARGRYVTVHMGAGRVAATDQERRSLPWPPSWIEALTAEFRP